MITFFYMPNLEDKHSTTSGMSSDTENKVGFFILI